MHRVRDTETTGNAERACKAPQKQTSSDTEWQALGELQFLILQVADEHGEQGDINHAAECERKKSHRTERRFENESTEKATEVQRKNRDRMCLSRNMGPKETARANETERNREHDRGSNQAATTKPGPVTENVPVDDT